MDKEEILKFYEKLSDEHFDSDIEIKSILKTISVQLAEIYTLLKEKK